MRGAVTVPTEGDSSGLGGKKKESSLGSVLASLVTLGKSLYPLRTGFPFQSQGRGLEAVVMVAPSCLTSLVMGCPASFPSLWGGSLLSSLGCRPLLLFWGAQLEIV